jgi:hypothetical protein
MGGYQRGDRCQFGTIWDDTIQYNTNQIIVTVVVWKCLWEAHVFVSWHDYIITFDLAQKAFCSDQCLGAWLLGMIGQTPTVSKSNEQVEDAPLHGFCLISVGYRLESCIGITFNREYNFSFNDHKHSHDCVLLLNLKWCPYLRTWSNFIVTQVFF